MFVTYSPDGDEPRTWEFQPGRVKTSRCQLIERRMKDLTGETRTYTQFQAEVQQGSAAARRVLLWHLLSTDHPTLRIEDVDPLADELVVEHSRQELEEIRAAVAKSSTVAEQDRTAMLEAIDAQIETARDDGGKAPSSNSGSATP